MTREKGKKHSCHHSIFFNTGDRSNLFESIFKRAFSIHSLSLHPVIHLPSSSLRGITPDDIYHFPLGCSLRCPPHDHTPESYDFHFYKKRPAISHAGSAPFAGESFTHQEHAGFELQDSPGKYVHGPAAGGPRGRKPFIVYERET